MLETAAVQDALERVLRSAGFVNSPRMSRCLRFLVEETLAGRSGELKEYSVGVRVFDKAESYDPAADPSVRVEASKLRAKLGRYYEVEGRLEPVLIEIPKGGYSARFSRRAGCESTQAGAETAPSPDVMPEGVASTATRGAPRSGRRTVWIGSTAAAVALMLLVAVLSRQTAPSDSQARDHRLLSDFPGGAGGASFSPDGQMIAFHRADLDDAGPIGSFQIWVKNVAGGRPLQLTFDEASAASASWSPKGDQILFNHRRGIWSVSPLGGTPRMVVEHGQMPRFSGDGERIVFEDVSPGRGIWIAGTDGSHRRRVAEKRGLGTAASPALSPDGRSVAFFQAETGSSGDIWVAPTEGGTPRRLTFDSSEGGGPVWTPDGRSIIYYSSRGGSQTLWRIPAGGGAPEPVTTGVGQDRDPDISRDGKQLVYSNFRITYALVLMDPAAGRQRELVQRRLMIWMPRFSSDGRRVAFSQQMDTGAHVFTIDLDASNIRQVTEGPGQHNLAPQWSDDGTSLYFFQSRPAPSLRKVSLLGGVSTDLMSWPDVEGAEIDTSGRSVVYVRTNDGTPSATVVRNLSTGRETTMDVVVTSPRWSPDAQTIVGWQPAEVAGGASRVVSCAVGPGTCQALERGSYPVVAPDGSRIFFLRQSTTRSGRDLWSIAPNGADAKRIVVLRPIGVEQTFDVSRRGEIVFVQHRETRAELWRAELPN